MNDLPPITGTLPQGSMADPLNLIFGGVSGQASGTVSDAPPALPPGIEAQLAAVGLTTPPPTLVVPPVESAYYKVRIVGERGDQYISNGGVSLSIPRNQDVRVSAQVLEALRNSEGVQFTAVPD